ncbi:MAG: peptidylprolyl isomerase A [Gammaproteobacteria bacterium]|nr:MAG: peptidylprolyl isomerase A [Gammaproteobacteria bacterium]
MFRRVLKNTGFIALSLVLLMGLNGFLRAGPVVVMETSLGNIEITLDDKKAPISTKNFLKYVDEGFYEGIIFHRVIPGFMVQGGGFDQSMTKKDNHVPITNEADNGLKNVKGSIAMARTSQLNSATSQFFINTVDNNALDHRPGNFGYAVFGNVSKGMGVLDKIESAATMRSGSHGNLPKKQIVIKKAYRKKK